MCYLFAEWNQTATATAIECALACPHFIQLQIKLLRFQRKSLHLDGLNVGDVICHLSKRCTKFANSLRRYIYLFTMLSYEQLTETSDSICITGCDQINV